MPAGEGAQSLRLARRKGIESSLILTSKKVVLLTKHAPFSSLKPLCMVLAQFRSPRKVFQVQTVPAVLHPDVFMEQITPGFRVLS